MTDYEKAVAVSKYYDSFPAFLYEQFGITTGTDFSKTAVEHTGHEATIIAHICWKMLFRHDHTIMVISSNRAMSFHWQKQVIAAIDSLPDYLKPEITRSNLSQIHVKNGVRVDFNICHRNVGRGMTINSLYVMEPNAIKPAAYQEFVVGIWPALYSINGRQIVQYWRSN